jgi:cell division protein ZapB
MNEANPKSAVDLELKRLEKRLEDLIVTVSQIKEENRALRQRQDTLTSERAGLLQKNEQVRARVEAMIGRLKSMEQALATIKRGLACGYSRRNTTLPARSKSAPTSWIPPSS